MQILFFIFATYNTQGMFKIKSVVCENDCVVDSGRTVMCPSCKKRLFNVEFAKGAFIVRMKCPRCKNFIDIQATGIE